jgi:hypothetical protein
MLSVFMLGVVIKLYTPSVNMLGVFKNGCLYAESHYTECHYAECHGAHQTTPTLHFAAQSHAHPRKKIFSIIFIFYFRHFLQKSMDLFENLISL